VVKKQEKKKAPLGGVKAQNKQRVGTSCVKSLRLVFINLSIEEREAFGDEVRLSARLSISAMSGMLYVVPTRIGLSHPSAVPPYGAWSKASAIDAGCHPG